jgi:LPS export ABC transporter permease LptF
MGRLVTRGVLLEMAGPFAVSLLLTNMMFILLQLLQLGDVVFGSSFSAGFLARLCIYTLPHYLVLTLPLSVMAAAVVVFGRMADENEILALEAGGVSPLSLYPAPLLVGAVAAAASLILQLHGEPLGMRLLYGSIVEALKDNVSCNFQAGVFNDEIPGTVLYFDKKGLEERSMEKILIYQTDSRGKPILLTAKSGHVTPLAGRRGLALELEGGALHQAGEKAGEYRVVEFEKNTVAIDIGKVIDSKTKFFQAAGMMTPSELREAIKAEPSGSKERRRLEVVLHSRYATAIAVILLVLAAVPLAASRFRGGRAINISLVLGLLLVYYISLRIGTSTGETGKLSPAAAVWIPDLVLLAAAIGTPRLRGISR